MNWYEAQAQLGQYLGQAAHYAPRLGLRYGTQIRRGYGGVPVARQNQLLGVHQGGAAAVGAASTVFGKKKRVDKNNDSSNEEKPPQANVRVEDSSSGETRIVPKRPPRKVTNSFSEIEASVENLPQHAQANTGSVMNNGDEVPVIPPPRKVVKIHPDYFTVNLPWVTSKFSTTPAFVGNLQSRPLATIRLNSIYDPMKEINATIVGTSDDPLIESDSQPHGRHIWESHFKYYRVLEAHVTVEYVSSFPSPNGTTDPNKHSFICGYELTDEDGAISNTMQMFLMTKKAKREKLLACNTNYYWNGTTQVSKITHPQYKSFSYTYRPEAWQSHVEEAAYEERWTPIKQNPAIDHDFHLRMLHIAQGDPDANHAFGFNISITYKVQFREATDAFFKTVNLGSATYGGTGQDAADN